MKKQEIMDDLDGLEKFTRNELRNLGETIVAVKNKVYSLKDSQEATDTVVTDLKERQEHSWKCILQLQDRMHADEAVTKAATGRLTNQDVLLGSLCAKLQVLTEKVEEHTNRITNHDNLLSDLHTRLHAVEDRFEKADSDAEMETVCA